MVILVMWLMWWCPYGSQKMRRIAGGKQQKKNSLFFELWRACSVRGWESRV